MSYTIIGFSNDLRGNEGVILDSTTMFEDENGKRWWSQDAGTLHAMSTRDEDYVIRVNPVPGEVSDTVWLTGQEFYDKAEKVGFTGHLRYEWTELPIYTAMKYRVGPYVDYIALRAELADYAKARLTEALRNEEPVEIVKILSSLLFIYGKNEFDQVVLAGAGNLVAGGKDRARSFALWTSKDLKISERKLVRLFHEKLDELRADRVDSKFGSL